MNFHIKALLKLFLITSVLFLPVFQLNAYSAPIATRCYNIQTGNLPLAERLPSIRIEKWCYQEIQEVSGGLFIFNADHDQVLPELAMLKRPNGILTHGSLEAGENSVHSVRYREFYPFSIPLEEPRHERSSVESLSPRLLESSKRVLSLFLKSETTMKPLSLAESELSGEASHQPWRGYWWPNKGLPMLRPLEKFEGFAAARGRNLQATEWESSHHVSHGLWWEGHCNGWAAASILRPEPRSSFTDDSSDERFSVSDLKGILSEADYCAHAAVFGSRNNGNGDPNDIYPETFHRTLLYYIGSLHKPIAVDYRNDSVVDNRVISSYSMKLERLDQNRTLVTATLRLHSYDGHRSEKPGPAPSSLRTYRYILGEGRGRWLSENPDFLWVPLSPGRCSGGNPYMYSDLVNALERRQ